MLAAVVTQLSEAALRTGLRLRPMVDADLPFLLEVYADTRREELAQVPWTDEQRALFLRMQFEAQHAHYQQHYREAEFLVVEQHEQPVGRLYVLRLPREIRLVEIAMSAGARGHGLGTHLLAALIAEADAHALPLTIHVERNNPALAWYVRHGFRLAEDKGVYLFMERPPAR